ncbi:MAG: alpha/beta fold hydrolase [Pseudomonadota bacterium]
MFRKLKSLSLALLAVVGVTVSTGIEPGFAASKEQVVLLHGLARSSAHMADLEKFLEGKGYTVFNLDYRSTQQDLETITAAVATEIRGKMDPSRPIHFVGYSMGGIVTRAVLNKYRPDNLGRVVQLASPNKGSEVADLLKENILYKAIFGPAGQQLTTEDAGIDDLLGSVDYDLGVVAGNFSIDPVSSSIIPGDDDGKVSVESTKVSGMHDHIIVYASHTFFPQTDAVQEQTLHFLRTGFFKHSQ